LTTRSVLSDRHGLGLSTAKHYPEASKRQIEDCTVQKLPINSGMRKLKWLLIERYRTGRTALEKTSAKTAFPCYVSILFYERNYVEAERVSVATWQGKGDAINVAGLWSAMAARGQGDVEKMRSYLFQHVRLMNQH